MVKTIKFRRVERYGPAYDRWTAERRAEADKEDKPVEELFNLFMQKNPMVRVISVSVIADSNNDNREPIMYVTYEEY